MPRFLDRVGQTVRATVTETAESRNGSQRGAGGISEPREFRVIFVIPEQDRTELRMPDPKGFVQAMYPIGSLHPWNGYARVNGYGPVRRITAQHYLVGVQYGVGGPMGGTVQPDHRRWSLGVDSQGISQKIVEEPTLAFATWKDVLGLRRDALPLATQKFIPIADTEAAEGEAKYWAKVSKRDKTGSPPDEVVKIISTEQQLAKDGERRKPFDYTAELPGMAFIMTRVFPNFGLDGLGALADYKGTVNITPFRGATIGHVKMSRFNVAEVAMVIDDGSTQNEPGIAYRISLSFLWSSIPFIPFSLVPTFPDELGNEAVVYQGELGSEGSEKVVEEFYPIRGMDFDALIALIESLASRYQRGPGPSVVP